QTLLTFKETGNLVNYRQYMRDKLTAANEGSFYNPVIAYVPLKEAGRRTAYNTDYTNLSPRLSIAWNPTYESGWLGRLFGERKTVLRGGYSLVFDRTNTAQTIALPPLGIGFTQTLNLSPPRNAAGHPFRIGIDGPIPLPSAPAQLTSPIVPGGDNVRGSNTDAEDFSFTVDPFIKVPRNHVIGLTIQRELPSGLMVEAGYIGRFARGLYVNGNLNSIPFTHKEPQSGQTFAEALDALAGRCRLMPQPLMPQPYFENNYHSDFFNSYTYHSFAAQFCRGIGTVMNVFYLNGEPLLTNLQVRDLLVRTSAANSNYHGLFITLRRQYAQGLAFDLNYTLSHSLDQSPIATQTELATFQSSFFPEIDYG